MFKTIITPSFFPNLPKEIQDLVYEFNWEHRKLFQKVLSHLIDFTHCKYCNDLIALNIVHKISYCTSDCLYYSIKNDNDDYDYNYDYDYDDY